MKTKEITAEALRLDPKARAKLAEKLLHSLEQLSVDECDELWAEEACARDSDLDSKPELGKSAKAVLQDARRRIKQR